MTSNLRRSTRIGSKSSSCSSTPIQGGAAISVKIHAPNGVQASDEELARSAGMCVKQEPCEEVFASDRVVSDAACSTSTIQDQTATGLKPFPLLAGTPVTLCGTVFYECTGKLEISIE